MRQTGQGLEIDMELKKSLRRIVSLGIHLKQIPDRFMLDLYEVVDGFTEKLERL